MAWDLLRQTMAAANVHRRNEAGSTEPTQILELPGSSLKTHPKKLIGMLPDLVLFVSPQ